MTRREIETKIERETNRMIQRERERGNVVFVCACCVVCVGVVCVNERG